MSMIPARYTTPLDTERDQRKDGVIRLEERSERALIEMYETYKDNPFEGYVERLLLPHKEPLCALFHDAFASIKTHKTRKRDIKNQYVSGAITNREQSQRIQIESKLIEQKQTEIKEIFEDYCTSNSIQIPPVHREEAKKILRKWQASNLNGD